MSSDASLDVPAVVAQFREAEERLAELRERLRAIVLAEEGAERAATSIQEASNHLVETARALTVQTEAIDRARSVTLDALDAARTFMEGTDLSAMRAEAAESAATTQALIRDEFAALRTAVFEQQMAIQNATDERLGRIETALAALSSRLPEIESLRAENETLKASVPPRVRKRLGL